MDNLKSAEAAKREILDRIAKKLAANSGKTEIGALGHASHSSTHSSLHFSSRHSSGITHKHGNVH